MVANRYPKGTNVFTAISARRAITGALTCALALAVCLSGAPADAVITSPSTNTDAGLFGSADPTYTGVYRQSLALIALVAAGETPPPVAVSWLVNQQCADGGFQGYKPANGSCTPSDRLVYSSEDSNTTAVALQALSLLNQTEAAGSAAKWLKDRKSGDNGFAYYPDQSLYPSDLPVSDANSTALVLMGLNAYNDAAASLNPPVTDYVTTASDAKAFLQTLQPAACPSDGVSLTTDGEFLFQAGGPLSNYATVQASFALSGHQLSDGPYLSLPYNEPTFSCANPPTLDPYDPALVSAGYISRWIDTAPTNPFVTTDPSVLPDPSDEPAWAALSLLASGVTPQSSIDSAAAAMHANVSATSTDPGLLAMDILTRHAEPVTTPPDPEHAAIPGLVNRLLATLAPVNSIAPKVAGTVKVGKTISCDPGLWTKGSVKAPEYLWVIGTNTVIARTQSVTLAASRFNKKIHCSVKVTNAFGSTTRASASLTVGRGTMTNLVLPTIVGSVRAGGYVAATSGTWSPMAMTAKIVWKRGTTVVGTGFAYHVKDADRGKKLTVVVTVTSPGYAGTATSKPRTVR